MDEQDVEKRRGGGGEEEEDEEVVEECGSRNRTVGRRLQLHLQPPAPRPPPLHRCGLRARIATERSLHAYSRRRRVLLEAARCCQDLLEYSVELQSESRASVLQHTQRAEKRYFSTSRWSLSSSGIDL